MKWRSEEVRLEGLEAGVVSVAPASHEDRPHWLVVTKDAWLRRVDLDDGRSAFEAKLPFDMAVPGGVTVVVSPSGRFVAAAQTHGTEGALYDVSSGRLLKSLRRGDYHPDVSAWALALTDERLFLATDWNRIEAWALPSCERLRPTEPETKLDYFYGRAALSPSQKWLATFGWHWHPIGALNLIDVEAWLGGTSSADGRPAHAEHTLFAEWWDASVCFVDEQRVALIGETPAPDDDLSMMQTQRGLLLYDFTTGAHPAFFPGLMGHTVAFDGERLVLLGETVRAVSPHDGAVLATLETKGVAWHPGNRTVLSVEPLAQHWLIGTRTSTVELPSGTSSAELSVLADALEERGGEREAIEHLRAGRPHGRRCHVIEAFTR